MTNFRFLMSQLVLVTDKIKDDICAEVNTRTLICIELRRSKWLFTQDVTFLLFSY